ncbi:MAG TPA: AAA family ATPase [Actinomycetota bacterium]|nr:AAA family ATPase [Actinomycetota bacterium]
MDDALLPLRGRAEELSRIATVLREESAHGPAFVIQGEPGIGKSRLVDEVVSQCAGAGWLVLKGFSLELEHDRPFGPLIEAFRLEHQPEPGFKPVADLLTGNSAEGVSATTPMHYRILQGLLDGLEQAARRRRLLLVLEDAHWADHGTILFLTHLVRRSADLNVPIIVTRRTWPRSPDLDRIEEHPGVDVIRLSSLLPEDAVLMAEDVAGTPLHGGVRAKIDAAGGNPLLILELMASLRHQSSTALTPDADRPADLSLSLRASLSRRLSFLSDGCLQMLRFGSVLGLRFSFHDLQISTGLSATELLSLIDEGTSAGILHDEDDRLVFRHDLVRAALYEDIPPAVRKGLHREVALKLAAEGAPAGTVAVHFSLGAKEQDPAAVAWLRKAAADAAPRSPAIAADLLQRALQVADPTHPERDEMTSQLISALLWSGQFHRAEARAEEMLLRGTAADTGAAVRYALGRVLVYSGDVTGSLSQVEEALADDRISPGWRARLLAEASLRQLVCGRVKDAYESAMEALNLAREHNDSPAATVALCSLSRTAAYRSNTLESIDLARRAVAEGSRQTIDAIQSVQPLLYLGMAQIDAGRLIDAQRSLEDGGNVAEEIGARWILPLFHLGLALVHEKAGRWDDCLVEAETALSIADEVGTKVWVPWTLAVIAHLHIHRGRLEEATNSVQAIKRDLVPGPQFGWEWIALAKAELNEALGDADSALQILKGEWDHRAAVEPLGDHKLFGPMLVRLLVPRDLNSARGISDVLVSGGERSGTDSALATAALARGSVEADLTSFEASIAGYEKAGHRHDLAAACERAVDGLEDILPRDDRVVLLRRALEIYEDLGAELDAARAARGLRSLGVRRGVRGRRARPSSGWDSLTDTERTVVALVADGLSNKEIGRRLYISHRTVGHHVSHVLTKLGKSSRVELAAAIGRAETRRE